jgi:CobQ-like glutamine amidotransferase family enzyme
LYSLNICVLYPDLLNYNGDRGNIIALSKRALWRNISVNIINVTLDEPFVPEKYDIVVLGSGQEYEQQIIRKDFIDIKGNEIRSAIENNKVFLCIGGGYQMLGMYLRTLEGKEIEFLGALDLWTIEGRERLTGDIVFECDFLKSDTFDGKIVGFENHSGYTYLGEGVEPLGRVVKGFGNNGQDGFEGARYRNVFCSYAHGSLLPKNHELADHLLTLALKEKYPDFSSLSPLDDSLEKATRMTLIERIIR